MTPTRSRPRTGGVDVWEFQRGTVSSHGILEGGAGPVPDPAAEPGKGKKREMGAVSWNILEYLGPLAFHGMIVRVKSVLQILVLGRQGRDPSPRGMHDPLLRPALRVPSSGKAVVSPMRGRWESGAGSGERTRMRIRSSRIPHRHRFPGGGGVG
jgi:hypothetical protein